MWMYYYGGRKNSPCSGTVLVYYYVREGVTIYQEDKLVSA
jgi:hypothetical protein